MKASKRKKVKRGKMKFVRSLLRPLEVEGLEEPYLVKQRVQLSAQISLPEFKKSEFKWLSLFKNTSEQRAPLQRSLIPDQRETHMRTLAPLVNKQKSINKNIQASIEKEPDKPLSMRIHSRNISNSVSVFEHKLEGFHKTTRLFVPKPGRLTSRTHHKSSPSYTHKAFDSSVIPRKNPSILTAPELMAYIEYTSKLPFK